MNCVMTFLVSKEMIVSVLLIFLYDWAKIYMIFDKHRLIKDVITEIISVFMRCWYFFGKFSQF